MTVYDMCIKCTECVEGELALEWKYKPVAIWAFKEALSIQMLKYDPIHLAYHRDAQMKVCTYQRKKNYCDD